MSLFQKRFGHSLSQESYRASSSARLSSRTTPVGQLALESYQEAKNLENGISTERFLGKTFTVSNEGIWQSIKDFFKWIVDKIKSFWNKIFGKSSGSSSSKVEEKTKENKEGLQALNEAIRNAGSASASAAEKEADKQVSKLMSPEMRQKYNLPHDGHKYVEDPPIISEAMYQVMHRKVKEFVDEGVELKEVVLCYAADPQTAFKVRPYEKLSSEDVKAILMCNFDKGSINPMSLDIGIKRTADRIKNLQVLAKDTDGFTDVPPPKSGDVKEIVKLADEHRKQYDLLFSGKGWFRTGQLHWFESPFLFDGNTIVFTEVDRQEDWLGYKPSKEMPSDLKLGPEYREEMFRKAVTKCFSRMSAKDTIAALVELNDSVRESLDKFPKELKIDIDKEVEKLQNDDQAVLNRYKQVVSTALSNFLYLYNSVFTQLRQAVGCTATMISWFKPIKKYE